MKKKKIYHLDIKPLNILSIENNHNHILKFSDFGESKWNENNLRNNFVKGTIIYMSPELLLIFSKSKSG